MVKDALKMTQLKSRDGMIIRRECIIGKNVSDKSFSVLPGLSHGDFGFDLGHDLHSYIEVEIVFLEGNPNFLSWNLNLWSKTQHLSIICLLRVRDIENFIREFKFCLNHFSQLSQNVAVIVEEAMKHEDFENITFFHQ
ncbi:hypothetical protein PV325_005438 [Microctonus aethiopoides]|nr:hypothetical protein PV325_005438 [Microctonus aethiopoides]KAK0083972.1 hypothetical protein PV326_006456 [Microctonus aethiopoides]